MKKPYKSQTSAKQLITKGCH